MKQPTCLLYAWYSLSQVPDSSLTISAPYSSLSKINHHLEEPHRKPPDFSSFFFLPLFSLKHWLNRQALIINIPTSMFDVSCSVVGMKTFCYLPVIGSNIWLGLKFLRAEQVLKRHWHWDFRGLYLFKGDFLVWLCNEQSVIPDPRVILKLRCYKKKKKSTISVCRMF